MRVLFLGNNRLGCEVARWLAGQGVDIVGAVVHPPERARLREEILAACGIEEDLAIDGSKLREPETLETVRALRPDIGVSILFGYILRRPLLDLMARGCINLHPSLLPYNRGAHPNVWSIVEGTPAGASLHYIDEQVDTGDIIAQREVVVEPIDTGETLYRKCEDAALDLFRDSWPAVADGSAEGRPQAGEGGSEHRVRDLESLVRIDPERTYSGAEIIDLLRALTFPPHDNAYIERDGRRVYLRLELYYRD